MRASPGVAIGSGVVRFYCIEGDLPEETPRLLREACEARGISYRGLDARAVDLTRVRGPRRGDILFRPATEEQAAHVEQLLYRPGVATFYRDPAGPSRVCTNPTLLYERSGIPVARSLPAPGTDRERLRDYVEHLGGLPLVVKVGAHSGGVGVLRVESLAALFSVVDLADAQGERPLLCAYVPDAVHWRLVVVGDQIASAYINVTEADDFRTATDEDPSHYRRKPNAALVDAALRATQVLGLDHAGVDLLEHPSGRLYVLEANFPCYFATEQMAVGTDIAGAMVDFLAARAQSLSPEAEGAHA